MRSSAPSPLLRSTAALLVMGLAVLAAACGGARNDTAPAAPAAPAASVSLAVPGASTGDANAQPATEPPPSAAPVTVDPPAPASEKERHAARQAALAEAAAGGMIGSLSSGAPDASSVSGQCALLLRTIRDGHLRRNEVTVLTPHADETASRIDADTAASVGKLTISDPRLKDLAARYRKALQAVSAAVHAFARVYETRVVPSQAIQQQVRDSGAGERKAQGAIEAYCSSVASP